LTKRSKLDDITNAIVSSSSTDTLPDINGGDMTMITTSSATHPPAPAVLRDNEDALYMLLSVIVVLAPE
jgi:hypothetical protein